MVSSQSNKKINNNNPKKFVDCPQIWFKYFFNGSIQLTVMWHMSLPDLRCVQQHNQLDMFPGSTVIKAHDWLLGGERGEIWVKYPPSLVLAEVYIQNAYSGSSPLS